MQMTASPTIDYIASALEQKAALSHSPYYKRSLKIRLCCFRCLGTRGFGMKGRREDDCRSKSKRNFILCSSKCLSGVATGFLSLITCGAYACYECRGCLKDRAQVAPE
jgi:hypothetical protein